MRLESATAMRILLLVALAVTSSACDAIGFIFKAGMYTGVIAVVIVVALVWFLVSKMRR
jgi:hypothetical protein